MDTSPGDAVRSGYNALSRHYRGDDDTPQEYQHWLADLQGHIPRRSRILDIGCGCGVPVARQLADAGHHVTGVDISDVQIERARQLVPSGTFIRADITATDFPQDSFDAVICLYALIHMPLDDQPRVLLDIARWLRPGGWLLATTGQDAWTGTEDNWLGGPATMWWSHTDAATYRSWIRQAGLEITSQQFVPEGDSGHAVFWARRSASAQAGSSPETTAHSLSVACCADAIHKTERFPRRGLNSSAGPQFQQARGGLMPTTTAESSLRMRAITWPVVLSAPSTMAG
jgi:2-polyprenyl-3-methyl-5-hydroxy-6-metoxy-1,4-benzoquinol methylase